MVKNKNPHGHAVLRLFCHSSWRHVSIDAN